jgi:preprotein translocase subunit SecA
MERMGLKDDEPIEHRWITSSIENAQKKVEGHNFNIRKNLLEYDDVMNLQRKAVYDLRRRALTGENVRTMMLESITALIEDLMDEHVSESLGAEDWNTAALKKRIEEVFAIQWSETPEQLKELSRLELRQRLESETKAAYLAKEAEIGEEGMRQLERMLLLQFADQFWKDHLLAMDRLRDGIGLRGYGQRNPLLEYKKEAFQMFQLMNSLRDEAVVSRLLRIQMQVAETAASAPSKAMARKLSSGALDEELDGAEEPPALPDPVPLLAAPPPRALPAKGAETRLFALEHGIRRNDPCPCGSGAKFKKCCYEEPAAAPQET